jgi:2-hydroxy-3-keto-5-methylthiopentenyl-1-phosphate phosphatase
MVLPDLHLLRQTSVFLDFDGTATTADIGVVLLERFGAPGWRALDRQYSTGAIGSRECLIDEWALVEAPEAELRAAAREVPLDPGFLPLVHGLRAAGAEVTIVSDGFGFYVEEACALLGIPVLTNAVDFGTGELLFPYEERCCPCSTCGMCKQAPVKDAQYRRRHTVLVGDGISDRKAALLADTVFAKDGLGDWCARNGVAHTRFETLSEVRGALLGS